MQSVEKKKRDVTLDVAKGILIFLVVWGHAIQFGFGYEYGEAYQCFNDYIYRWIYSFHMPLFMAISGYLYFYSNQRPFAVAIISRLRSIGIPYLIYCTIKVMVLLPTVIWGGQELAEILSTYENGFWFLPSVLFNCMLISAITKITRRKSWVVTLLLLSTILLLITPDEIIGGLYRCMYMCFVIGYTYNLITGRPFAIKRYGLSLLPLIIGGMIICAFAYKGWMYIYTTDFRMLERYAIALLGSICFMSIVAWHTNLNNKLKLLICNLSRYSLGIYCLSVIIQTVYYKILGNLDINLEHNYIYPVFLSFVITCVSYKILNFCEDKRILNKLLLGGR